MKLRFLFLLATICCAMPAMAQNEQNAWSVLAAGAFGRFGNEVQVGAEFPIGRFSLGAGLSYLGSVHLKDTIDLPYPNSNKYFKELGFRHLMLPVTLAYRMPMGRRFAFIPMLSAGVSYNIRARYSSWTDQYQNYFERNISGNEYDGYFRRISLWAGAAVRVSYKLSERVSIFAGVHGRYMLLPVSKSGPSIRAGNGGIGGGLQYQFINY